MSAAGHVSRGWKAFWRKAVCVRKECAGDVSGDDSVMEQTLTPTMTSRFPRVGDGTAPRSPRRPLAFSTPHTRLPPSSSSSSSPFPTPSQTASTTQWPETTSAPSARQLSQGPSMSQDTCALVSLLPPPTAPWVAVGPPLPLEPPPPHPPPVALAAFFSALRSSDSHSPRPHSTDTGDRPYKCQHCGDQFARRSVRSLSLYLLSPSSHLPLVFLLQPPSSDLLSRHVNKCHANEKPLVSSAPNRRKGAAAACRATTSKQACDQCVQSSLPCDGANPCCQHPFPLIIIHHPPFAPLYPLPPLGY